MKKFFTLTLALMATICMCADDCTTLVSFATSQHQTSNPRKVYGYTTTEMTESSKVELTCDHSDTKGQNDGAEIRLNYSKYLQIPEQTSVTSVTIDYKFYNSGSTQRTCSLKVEIGSTVKQVEISGKNSDGYKTAEFTFSPAATGAIKITHMGSGSSNLNLYLDNITYCTAVAETHALAWDFAGGSCSATEGEDYTAEGQVAEGATITYPANNTMTKDGYDFNGWSTSETTMPTNDLTIIAQWVEHTTSTDATLADLTVAGETIEGFDPATIEYNVELPFGTSVVPVVAGTANSPYAKSVEANQAAALPGVATIVVTAEDNSTKTYTINFTVAESKDIIMVWKTGNAKCNTEASYVTSSVILSTNDAVKDYLSISFEQTTEDNTKTADEKSGSYLSTGKSVGNLVKITAKTGYAFKAMGFYGKIETAEEKCPVSINGGKSWIDVTGNLGSDAKHCDVFTNAETAEIILKNNGGAGTWIRHMELTIINSEVTPTAIDNTEDEVKAVKVLRDGQIFIEKNGHVYNVFGACVK